jgi:hypothetical protein
MIKALKSRRWQSSRPITKYTVCFSYDGICPACGRESCWEDSLPCERKEMERLLLVERKIYGIPHVAKALGLTSTERAMKFLQEKMPTQIYWSRWLFSRKNGRNDGMSAYVYRKDLLDCLDRHPTFVLKCQERFQRTLEKREQKRNAEHAFSGYKRDRDMPEFAKSIHRSLESEFPVPGPDIEPQESLGDEQEANDADGGSP